MAKKTVKISLNSKMLDAQIVDVQKKLRAVYEKEKADSNGIGIIGFLIGVVVSILVLIIGVVWN